MPIRALVVDDEEDMRVVATVFLEMDGEFEVVSVCSGREAVLAAITGAPDVILLDYMMPDMDGPATLAVLKSNPETRDIPVVFLTAKSDPDTDRDLRAAGAVGVIRKPFSPETLAKDLSSLLGGPK